MSNTPDPTPTDPKPPVEPKPAPQPEPVSTTDEPEVAEASAEDYADTMEVDEEMGSTST